MYINERHINAGQNEIHKFGHKSRECAQSFLTERNGYISIPVATKHWTFGTTNGKYGEFCKINGTIFSVNAGGFCYAKAGTDKGEALCKAIASIIDEMTKMDNERIAHLNDVLGVEAED